jgi:putative two-component system response regulator
MSVTRLTELAAGGLEGEFVLVVSFAPTLGLIAGALERHGVRVRRVASQADAMTELAEMAPAVVLIDVAFADRQALHLCRYLKSDSATRLVPVLLMVDSGDRETRLAAIHSGADVVFDKPVDVTELVARVGAAMRARRYTSDLDSAAGIIMTLTAMIEARESAPGHCFRMANYALALGRTLGLADADRRALYRGAFLHDIGMLAIPDAILRKGSELEADEFEVIKAHPVIGDALCANLTTLQAVRPIVRHHHERLDGSGYPDGLRSDAVPLLAQIVSIVDVFEAVTMGRAYIPPRSAGEAVRILREEVMAGWRRGHLVEAFATLVSSGALEAVRIEPSDASV